MIQKISFKNNRKQTLRGYVHVPRKYDTAIVFLHGFPGSCEGSAKRLGRVLSFFGYLVMRFDFSGTNISDGRFEDKTMSQEVREIRYGTDYLCKKYKFRKLILIGLSTGAVDAALYAHTDDRITKLVLLSGLVDLKKSIKYDFSPEQIKNFKNKGYITYSSPDKWYDNKRLKKKFFDEYLTLDIKSAVKNFHKPVLVVHGTDDDLVPLKNGIELFKTANDPKQLFIIKNANHTYKNIWHGTKLVLTINRFIKYDIKN